MIEPQLYQSLNMILSLGLPQSHSCDSSSRSPAMVLKHLPVIRWRTLGNAKGTVQNSPESLGGDPPAFRLLRPLGLWRWLDKMSILPKPNSTLVKWVELDYLSNSSVTKLHLVLFVKARERYTFQICVSAGSGTCEPARNAGGWHTGSYVRCFRVGHPVSLPYFSTLQWPKEMLIAITLTLTASCV